MSKTINEIIQQNKKIPEIYVELQNELELKYGNNVVILFEIGSFYEIYQIGNVGKAQEIAQLCNIALTRKNKKIETIDLSNPMLCGIPSIKLDKYLDILIREEIYTIVVIKQEGLAPNIKRVVDKLISPGTNIDFISKTNKNNYISSVFLEKLDNGIILGSISSIDLTSGNVYCFQSDGNEIDKLLPLDEIYNHMNIYDGKEIILTLDNISSKDDIELIKSKLDLSNKVYVIYNFEDKKKSLNIKHQNEILKNVFNINSMLSPMEYLDFDNYFNISSSLVLLIEFIIDHNNKIVYNLKNPIILNNNKQLYLGNNAIDQLEITSYGKNKGLIDIISKNLTSLGKRFVNNRILNPIVNKEILLNRYENSSKFINFTKNDYLKENLSKMYDMERLERKILINSIHPFELSNFYYSLQSFMKIYKALISDSNMKNLDILSNINIKNLIHIVKSIEESFDINNLSKYNLNNIDSSFINQNINENIDSLILNHNTIFVNIENIANVFMNLIDVNNSIKDKSNLVKINHNDTEGYFFTITKNRYLAIKDLLESLTFELDGTIYNFSKDLTYKTLVGTVKINSQELKNVSDKLISLQSKIINETIKYYNNFINELSIYKSDLSDLSTFLGELEFYLLNANLFNNYAYCVPTILDLDESFIEAKDIRHPIIERFEDRGIYVPNDIVLGNKNYISKVDSFDSFYDRKETSDLNGIMLYGLNSSGKSSLMKSVGINIILAQAGFFVSALSFRYTLFESLFTRISGKDDIYKGLSSFAVEMVELRNIFNRVNGKSLVLGDEISHGTETISGMSIVASSVITLLKKKSNFIFATHLHQLNDIEEYNRLKNVINLHLSVKYNEEEEKLIYDRKIKYGSGSSIYGLEFAKFIDLDKDFLKIANDIRKNIAKDLTNLEMIKKQKKSIYNSNVYYTKCAFCDELAIDIHHLKEQNQANDNKIIDHHRMNHKYNLVPLCKKHHDIIHKYQNPNEEPLIKYIQTSNGIELEINEILKDKL